MPVNLSAVNKIKFYLLCNTSHFYLLTFLLTFFFSSNLYIVTDATAALNNKSTKLNNTVGVVLVVSCVAVMSITWIVNKPDMPINNVS